MWTFLNPLFLWAAAAAVIPLLLHLLQKRRVVRVPFSTLRFLKLAQRRSASRVRLENLLLWLLRTVMLLLLALAFALPVLRTGALGDWLGSARRDVAIIWDVSYSMEYESGRARVWDAARETILAILDGLPSGDRVCVFLAGDQVTPLIEQPTGDLELVRSLVKAQAPRPGSSQLAPAYTAAVAALETAGSRERELFIITDGQARPWADGWPEAAPPTAMTTYLAWLGPTAPRNDAIADVRIQPGLLMTTTPVKISAQLVRTGPATETSVALLVDEQEIARRTTSGEIEFTLPPLSRGTHLGRLEVPADGIAGDNMFHFLLRVRDQLPVLVIGSETDGFFLLRALNPTGEARWQVTRQDPSEPLPSSLAQYPAIFLCNALPVPGQSILDLEHYVRGGGVLIFFPGDRAGAADYASWNCLPADVTGAEDREATRTNLRLEQPGDPLFQGVQLPPGTVPSVTVRRQLRFAMGEGQVLLRAGDEPFLVSRRFGGGRVLLAAVSADRRWSDLPLSPFFLPLVHQVVQFGAGSAQERGFEWAAADLRLNVTASETVTGPDGRVRTLRWPPTPGGALPVMEDAILPGIYRSGAEPVLAVNLSRAESNLTPLEEEALPLASAFVARDREELLRLVQQQRIGRPFAEMALWIVLVLAMIELWLANRAGRRPATVSDRLTVAPSGRVAELSTPV